MSYKQRFTTGRIIWFILSCLPPLISIFAGVISLLNGLIINNIFLITYFILPLVYSAVCYLLIFSKIKISLKVILFIFLEFLSLFLYVFISFLGQHEIVQHHSGDKALANYTDGSLHEQIYPVMPEIGEPVNVEFCEYDLVHSIFTSETDALICQYNEDDYWVKKNALEVLYTFQTEPITANDKTCIPTAQIDDYNFRLLTESDEDEWDMKFPKSIALIATNDTTYEIVYIAFYDQDLDYVESLTDFINQFCGWKHIR